MKIIPAIDIRNGMCVRLTYGEIKNEKVYGDPLEFALRWQEEGADMIHLVDLDAAFTGEFRNKKLIQKITSSLKIPVQLGGGARTKKDIMERLDDCGISRLIAGTIAIEDPGLVRWAHSTYPDRFIVGIDARDGRCCTNGWVEETDVSSVELAREVHKMGIQTIVYTDISREGSMKGPNIAHVEEIVKKTWINIIAAGGISSVDDLISVRNTGAYGAIIGKALYEGLLTLRDAIKYGS